MKKVISLSTLILILCSASPTRSNVDVPSVVKISKAPQVPNTVLTAFNNVVANQFGFWFPGATYDLSGITWDHVQGDWVASGDVTASTGGGIHYTLASFKHNGTNTGLIWNFL